MKRQMSDSCPRRVRSRLSATAWFAVMLAAFSLLVAASGTAADGGQTRLLVKFAPTTSTFQRGATLVGVNARQVSATSTTLLRIGDSSRHC
jgi:outer membrane receptor protein involved in Fe transport